MRTFLFIFMVIFFTNCGNKQVEQVVMQTSLRTINVPLEETKNNDFIESASYIFLDPEYLVGKISRLLFFNNNIYVQDEITDRIVVFSMNGKYMFHINNKGKGPLEYLKISDFTIDEANGNILIYDEQSHKILSYSIDKRKFIRKQKVNFYPIAFAWNSDCLYYYNPYTFNYPRDDKYHYSLIKTSVEMGKEKRYFRIDEKMGNFMSDPNPKGFFYGTNLCMLNRFDNIIYSLTKDSIYARYKVLFAENGDYQNALYDAMKKGTRNTDRYNRCATDIQNYCETENLITFNYLKNKKRYSVIFSKDNNKIIFHQSRFAINSPSSLKRNIPIICFPSNVKGNLFVSIIPFQIMSLITNDEKFKKSIIENMTNRELVEKLKHLDENSNPIIVFYNLKH